jgi:hypothetical protein
MIGDLRVMIYTLLLCSTVLSISTIIKNGSDISNAMLFTYTFLAAATYFTYNLYENKKLTHEKRTQPNYIKKLVGR